MTKDKEEQKRSHLRLVVNNQDLRCSRPTKGDPSIIPFEELVAQRELFRADFYGGIGEWQARAYRRLEGYLQGRGLQYGLDPRQSRLLVLRAMDLFPEVLEHGGSPLDEAILFVTEYPPGEGLALSMEMLLPFWSEDDTVMEDVLLHAPLYPYGTLFLEENRNDGYLDLIYRVTFPLYPPPPTGRLLDRFFAVARHEVRDTLLGLEEYSGG